MKEQQQGSGAILGLIGSSDFCRRLALFLAANRAQLQLFKAGWQEAWSEVLAHRPNLLVIEVGVLHSPRHHQWLRGFLQQVRERYGKDVYLVLALTAPEKLTLGGDLLFLNQNDLTPSRWIDTFIAAPPGMATSVPGLGEQLLNTIELFSHELERRTGGKPALPPLGSEGWVQSLADPVSRELWMRWLPRYASYTNENPIIIGETGTGKTNLAYALHQLSGRTGKFVSVTPRDFSSPELVQAELFGAVPGAYTGAVEKWGLVKSAEGGTLFIDELQSIDKDLQGKLITFIENKVYRRVGSAESIEANVRFVFASNKSLYQMMQADILRHDFAYRLERVQLTLPPLHLRKLDVCAGLAYALAKIHRLRPHRSVINGISSTAYRMLASCTWPGNLRQLENKVAQLCEVADMEGLPVIDERVVSRVVEPEGAGVAVTTAEVLAHAALRLSDTALIQQLDSAEQGAAYFRELAREMALEANAGDAERAAGMIKEDPALMHLFAQTRAIAKEGRRHEQNQH